MADVSAVQSGLSYNVTVLAEKPQCSGWGEVISYNFTIVCETNCTNDYRDSGNSSTPTWVFPDVGTGVFIITVTAKNSCGEQTELAQKEISVGEPCKLRHVCSTWTKLYLHSRSSFGLPVHSCDPSPYLLCSILRL